MSSPQPSLSPLSSLSLLMKKVFNVHVKCFSSAGRPEQSLPSSQGSVHWSTVSLLGTVLAAGSQPRWGSTHVCPGPIGTQQPS